MDRLKTDIIGEGMPIVLDDLRFVQNVQNFAFEAIMKSFYPSVILYGCVGTDNGNGTMTVSAGALSLHGEICRVEEHIIDYTPPMRYNFEIIEEADNSGNKMFGDGVARDTYFLRRAKLVEQTQSNEYNPSFNSKNLLTRLSNQDTPFVNNEIVVTNNQRRYITETKKTAFNKAFGTNEGCILAIEPGGFQGEGILMLENNYQKTVFPKTAFNRNYASKTETLAGNSETTVVSPSSLQQHGDWQEPIYNGNWASENYFGTILKYRKKTNGNVQLLGGMMSDTPASSNSTWIFFLPEDYRPIRPQSFLAFDSNEATHIIGVATNGLVFIDTFSAAQLYINSEITLT